MGGPVGLGCKGKLVGRRRHITAAAGVLVGRPHPARLALALVDDKVKVVAKLLFFLVAKHDAGHTSTDTGYAQLPRCPQQMLRDSVLGVFAELDWTRAVVVAEATVFVEQNRVLD